MKKIKNIKEWVEAAKADRLMCRGVKSVLSGNLKQQESIHGILLDIESGYYSWSPETVELVEWQCFEDFAGKTPTSVKMFRREGENFTKDAVGYWQETGVTATATIQESEGE